MESPITGTGPAGCIRPSGILRRLRRGAKLAGGIEDSMITRSDAAEGPPFLEQPEAGARDDALFVGCDYVHGNAGAVG